MAGRRCGDPEASVLCHSERPVCDETMVVPDAYLLARPAICGGMDLSVDFSVPVGHDGSDEDAMEKHPHALSWHQIVQFDVNLLGLGRLVVVLSGTVNMARAGQMCLEVKWRKGEPSCDCAGGECLEHRSCLLFGIRPPVVLEDGGRMRAKVLITKLDHRRWTAGADAVKMPGIFQSGGYPGASRGTIAMVVVTVDPNWRRNNRGRPTSMRTEEVRRASGRRSCRARN